MENQDFSLLRTQNLYVRIDDEGLTIENQGFRIKDWKSGVED